jgi:hypothetical protein
MVVRHDLNVEAIGQMAALPPDLSPLQLGTRGEFAGNAFSLLGRVRLAYDEGSWTEWFALFGDGRHGWVAETQGFFIVSFALETPADFPGESELKPGQQLEMAGEVYRVTDRKETVCLGGEGELPFSAPPGRKGLGIDLMGKGGLFAGVEFSDEGRRLFAGRYVQFDELNFTNLRAVPGWSEEANETKKGGTTALNCPKCGAVVELRAAGLSMSAACGSCSALLDTSTPDLRLIREAQSRQRLKPRIPLGRRGFLFGVNYEVIGFQHVRDQESGWFEYLLFNPWQGFAWLVNYNAHWTFVRRLVESPEVVERGIVQRRSWAKFEGADYQLFAKAPVSTDFVLGEFYWKVKVGMAAQVSDFINPPFILSQEVYPGLGEETWSRGEYIEAGAVQAAFSLEPPLPKPVEIYLNQPNRYAARAQELRWLAPVLLLLLVAIQVFSTTHAARRQVLSGAYLYHAGATNPPVVSAPFVVEGGQQAVEFVLNAPVDNNWLELQVDVVEAETQRAVASFEQNIEHYHGYDSSDGSWNEGNQTQHVLVPGLPQGKYALVIETSADPAVQEMPYSVSVVRDVPIWSNFWIGVGLALVYPLYCWFRSFRFEVARWSNSDYSPYASSAGSGDD